MRSFGSTLAAGAEFVASGNDEAPPAGQEFAQHLADNAAPGPGRFPAAQGEPRLEIEA
ncbi:MAG TPA: hypothetical protein PLR35_03715 [Burkholderiaceae bacterium]|nr:hypothetical protein [Burkholderiaceae bacterium]